MKYQQLSPEQVETFLTRGFVYLPGAIPAPVVDEWTAEVWTRLGYDSKDPATWAEKRIHMPVHHRRAVSDFSPTAWAAICDLLGGEERIQQPAQWGDGFIVNLGLPTDKETWQPPSPQSGGWHKDGDFFRHYLDSPEQGLLTIILWSDVLPSGGATFVAGDSVPVVARYFADRPEGVLPTEVPCGELIKECHDFFEATGKAGDVYLLHPFQLHASSQNALRLPRYITNPPVSLKEPMRFDRTDTTGDEFSLVERAILRGLGVDRLDFRIGGEREKVVPLRVQRQAEMMEKERARLAAAGAAAS